MISLCVVTVALTIERVEQFLQAMRKLAVSMDHLMEVEDNETH